MPLPCSPGCHLPGPWKVSLRDSLGRSVGLVCPLGRCLLCCPIRTLTSSRWSPRELTPKPVILVLPAQVDYPIPTVLLHLHPIPRRLLRVRALFGRTRWAAPSFQDKSGLQENAWRWEGSGVPSDKRAGPARRNFQGRGMEPRLCRFSCLASSPRFEALARPQKALGLPQIQLGLPGMIPVPAAPPRVMGAAAASCCLSPGPRAPPAVLNPPLAASLRPYW